MPVEAETVREEHRRFLNRYYGSVEWVYDVSRKYYLLGRDRVLRELAAESWQSLIEVGPGTGRNLRILHKSRPSARLGGMDASDVMIDAARRRCPWAAFHRGFAEDGDLRAVLGIAPDRMLFSYCLSMVQDPAQALKNALSALAPDGKIVIVDFGGMTGIPEPGRKAFRAFLRAFHVSPPEPSHISQAGGTVEHGPLDYYLVGRIARTEDPYA